MTTVVSPIVDAQSARQPLRVGIQVDSLETDRYTAELVNWIHGKQDVVLAGVIVQEPRRPADADLTRNRRASRERVSAFCFRALTRLEELRFRRNPGLAGHLDRVPLESGEATVAVVHPRQSPSGLIVTYDDEDLPIIAELDLDVILRGGSGILRGGILRTSKFGVLSFHHGDNRVNRGVPPGFWEVSERESSTGFIIQRLTEELDGGEVLVRGAFATQSFFLRNQALVFAKSPKYMQGLLVELARTRMLPSAENPQPYSGPLRRQPSAPQIPDYQVTQLGAVLRTVVRRALKRHNKWRVAVTRGPWRNSVLWRGRELKAPEGSYLADPFLWERDGQTVCFVEEFSLASGRGSIAAYRIDSAGSHRLGIAIDESFHLSFPFIFAYRGNLYMCPETSANGDIRVYECVEFPLTWRLHSILMSNVQAVDIVIVENQGQWWMLTSIDETAFSEFGSELSAFVADTPLSTVWRPASSVPVVCTPDGGRIGGLVQDARGVYRVGQAQAFGAYGKSVTVNRVDLKADGGYTEIALARLTPDFKKSLGGVHHLSTAGAWCAFDYWS